MFNIAINVMLVALGIEIIAATCTAINDWLELKKINEQRHEEA